MVDCPQNIRYRPLNTSIYDIQIYINNGEKKIIDFDVIELIFNYYNAYVITHHHIIL